MKKISRFKVFSFMFLAALFLLNIFYLDPIIKSKYLDSEIRVFKNNSWKYSIIFSIIILFFFIRYNYKIHKGKLKIWNTSLFVLVSFFLSYLLKNVTDDLLLYINTIANSKDVVVVYKVIENKENKVFDLYNNKDFITLRDELHKINNYRIKSKNKSVYEYKNRDTIHVKFNRGIIGVNYIK
jgi:hypothetical protein